MLPTLDISNYIRDPESEFGKLFVEQLRETCHDPGFFYLAGHGIDQQLESELMIQAQQFFALPESQRHEIAIGGSPHFRGYTVLGDERTQGRRD